MNRGPYIGKRAGRCGSAAGFSVLCPTAGVSILLRYDTDGIEPRCGAYHFNFMRTRKSKKARKALRKRLARAKRNSHTRRVVAEIVQSLTRKDFGDKLS
jgi:hypothetical protein